VRAIRGRLCAIGSATAAALEKLHLKVDLVPEDATSEGVARAFEAQDLQGKRVLLPRAAEAREVIPEALRACGAMLDVVDAYRNVIPQDAATQAHEIWSKRRPDWIMFTSGSTVKNVLAVVPAGALDGVKIAAIGPATSAVIRKHGLEVNAEAQPSNVDGLISAITRALREQADA
jgi:uroporphyrinogen III methyltransferase/synthase